MHRHRQPPAAPKISPPLANRLPTHPPTAIYNACGFHVLTDVAPLKPRPTRWAANLSRGFPRSHGRGSIEAMANQCADVSTFHGRGSIEAWRLRRFHVLTDVAPLKRRRARSTDVAPLKLRAPVRSLSFHVLTDVAPLKQHVDADRAVGAGLVSTFSRTWLH